MKATFVCSLFQLMRGSTWLGAMALAAALATTPPRVPAAPPATDLHVQSAPSRPVAGGAGPTVVPNHFLRRWDPVTIFFDTPRGPAAAAPEDHPERIVRFLPEHAGAFSWLDSTTLQFRPAEPWPSLTTFKWQVDGKTTELATLVAAPTRTIPARDATDLDPVEAITLQFPEPVEPAVLAAMVTIQVRAPRHGAGQSQLITKDDYELKVLERPSRAAEAVYVLQLRQPIPFGREATISIRLAADDSAPGSSLTYSFSTAEPFRVANVGCLQARVPISPAGSRFTPEQMLQCTGERTVSVELTAAPGAVGAVEGRSLIGFSPAVAGLAYAVEGKTLRISGQFAAEQQYRVTVNPTPMQDAKGRPLELQASSELYLNFRRMPDFLRWTRGEAIVERLGPQMVPIEGRGAERVDLRIYPIDPVDPSFWPFPRDAVTVDESVRPAGPGEEQAAPIAPKHYLYEGDLARQLPRLGSPPYSNIVSLPLKKDGTAASFGLDLAAPLAQVHGKGAPGTYLVGIRPLDGTSLRSWVRVQATDLSLSTAEEWGAVKLVVTSLASAAPVPGARIRVEGMDPRGHWLLTWEGTTNESGIVTWSPPGSTRNTVRRISVRKGADALVLNPNTAPDEYRDNLWSDSSGIWLQWTQYELSSRAPRAEQVCHIFTERPVYRPDEPVHVKGYVRDRYQGALSIGATAGKLVVEGPGELTWTYPIAHATTGNFYHRFEEPDLPSGSYLAAFENRGGNRICSVSFKKEAYRLPTFEVRLHSPDTVPLDKPFDVALTAGYYSGGSAAELPVQWRVTQFPFTWQPKERKGFQFSSDARYGSDGTEPSSAQLDSSGVTDGKGGAAITIDPTSEPTAEPRSYVIEATVTGADEQTVTSTRRVVALPALTLGVKVPRYLEKAAEISPEVIAVGADDQLLTGEPITVRLYQRQWHSHLQASDFSDGVARYVTDVVEEKMIETTVASGAAPVSVPLAISEAGVYVVELEARDRLGRAQAVKVDLFAGGEQAVAWSKPTSKVFAVAQDKPSYNPGDEAVLVLQSPYQQAEALAILEAPDGNRYEWLAVRGGTASYRLKVLPAYVPRVPVHFVLMRPRIAGTQPQAGNGVDLGKPATMAATSWVRTNPVEYTVKVELAHPQRARPGDEIEVGISLSDPRGQPRPGEVTLWLVDQAVLALGKERELDPVSDFITPVETRLAVHDTRNMAVGLLPFAEKPGGDEGEDEAGLLDGASLRRKFEPVPFYDPAIAVGPDGKKTVWVRLPDNVTVFKIRAKAATGADRFGFATGQLAVRLPIVAQPALPRFVRPGDSFIARAFGRIVEGDSGATTSAIRIEGPGTKAEDTREVSLQQGIATAVDVPVKVAPPGAGVPGLLTVKAAFERKSDRARDGFEVTLPIVDDRRPVRIREMIDLAPGEPHEIPRIAEAVRPGTVARRLLVSDQPAVLRMAAALDFLHEYPYGCTEQRISKARARLALRKLRDLIAEEDANEVLEKTVADTQEWIAGTVDDAGLCAYWPGGRGYVSLSAWALQFLVEARAAGLPVDTGLFDTLTRSLTAALRSDYTRFVGGESYAERVWALAALNAAGRAQPAYAAELARRTQYLNLESLAQVVVALQGGAEPAAADVVAALVDEMWKDVVLRLHQGKQIFGGLQGRRGAASDFLLASETRSLAEMIRALHRIGRTDERFDALLQGLVTLGQETGWGTTNANAAALLALSEVFTPRPFAGPAARILAAFGADQKEAVISPESPVARLHSDNGDAGKVTAVAGTGPSMLVARLDTSYVPAQPAAEMDPKEQGFVVSRESNRVVDARAPLEKTPIAKGGTRLALAMGTMVEEHVQVVNPQERHFVAIVVPLAAGLEALNPGLETAPPEAKPSGRNTVEPTYVSIMDDHVGFYFDTLAAGTYDFYFRARATAEGTFSQPPARAEMMYDEAVWGQSAGALVAVQPVKQ